MVLNPKSDPMTALTIELLAETGTFIAALWAEQFPREFIQQVESVRTKINIIFASMLPIRHTNHDPTSETFYQELPQKLRTAAEDLYALTHTLPAAPSQTQTPHTRQIAQEIQTYLHPVLFTEASPLTLSHPQK